MSVTHDTHQITGTRWRLDASVTTAEFRVPNVWGLASVAGRFQPLDGWLEVDADDRWHMALTLDAASLDTGNRRRDKHLRSADFFGVADHPELRFRSHGATDLGGGRLRVEGELEAAGERIPLQLDVAVDHGDDRLELDTAATIDQRDLGMRWSPLRVIGTPTAVHVCARLRRER